MTHSLLWAYSCQQFHYFALCYQAGGANLSSLPFSYGLLSGGLDTSVSNNPLIRQWWTVHLVCKAANLPIHRVESSAVIRRPTLMISASGSNPLERCSKSALILRVIQLMNNPGPEALADPTLIMLREPHLGGTGGTLLTQKQRLRRRPLVHRQSVPFRSAQVPLYHFSKRESP